MGEITKFGDFLDITSCAEDRNIDSLVDRVQLFMDASRANGTKRAYRSDWKSFTEFCENLKLVTIPAEPQTVCAYIAWMAEKGLKVSTISRHLTTISQAHRAFRKSSPTSDYDVIRTFQGIKRTIGTAQKRAKPLMWSDMQKIALATKPSAIGRRDRALVLVGWAAALRRSEIVALNRDDIDFVDEGMIVTIRSSKTDQDGEGYLIGIPFASTSSIGVCPVQAMREHIEKSEIASGALFFAMGMAGKAYVCSHGGSHRLSGKAVNRILGRRMKGAGLDTTGYSGHSLRAGFITEAAKSRVPEHLIQLHTRHASVKIMRGYIRDGSLFNDNPMKIIY